VARYIYLNPYRAGSVASKDRWGGWWAPIFETLTFSALVDLNGCPPREWINERVSAELAVGE
jgi:hypothetical protein